MLQKLYTELGAAFTLGCVASFTFHFLHGTRRFPASRRTKDCLAFAQQSSATTGGHFAGWALSNGVVSHILTKHFQDSKLVTYYSSCLTAGIYSLRGGLKTAIKQAILGGTALNGMETIMNVVTRKRVPTARQLYYQQ